jgi:hypothetical protein
MGMGNHKRGLPGDASSASGPLAEVIAAQIRALSNLGQSTPSPESQARLLGLGLAGGIGFGGEPPWLVDLLRKRVTAQFGDLRALNGALELVSVSGQPGVRIARTGEIWLGRVLVLGAPTSSLRDLYGDDPMRPPPSLLERETRRAYRAAFLFRIPTPLLPEGMGARIVLPPRTTEPAATVTAFPCQTHPHQVDLVARAIVPDADPARLEAQLAELRQQISDRLRALMPFCGEELLQIDVELPRWDADDGWLEDPPPGTGWPAEIDLRISSRPPIYHLDRAAVAGLGLEGDLLLGWRGGDAIAGQLA